MLITYTRAPHTTCMAHRILRNCKRAETRMVELSEKTETLFAYLEKWCYSKVGPDKRIVYRFQSMAGRTTLLMDSAIF